MASAHDWRSVLEPVVARYREENLRRFFRGDAAFANPDVYRFLEQEGFLYAIRLPANRAPRPLDRSPIERRAAALYHGLPRGIARRRRQRTLSRQADIRCTEKQQQANEDWSAGPYPDLLKSRFLCLT